MIKSEELAEQQKYQSENKIKNKFSKQTHDKKLAETIEPTTKKLSEAIESTKKLGEVIEETSQVTTKNLKPTSQSSDSQTHKM